MLHIDSFFSSFGNCCDINSSMEYRIQQCVNNYRFANSVTSIQRRQNDVPDGPDLKTDLSLAGNLWFISKTGNHSPPSFLS